MNKRTFLTTATGVVGSAVARPAIVSATTSERRRRRHGQVRNLGTTPHLWIADFEGVLHWAGDTRALSGKYVNWSDRQEVYLVDLTDYSYVGDPWLSAGLLKDGHPIYLVKWETDWELPKLLHIQSIKDVELFGINADNYGRYVLDKSEWESRYGINADALERKPLARAVPNIFDSCNQAWKLSGRRELSGSTGYTMPVSTGGRMPRYGFYSYQVPSEVDHDGDGFVCVR